MQCKKSSIGTQTNSYQKKCYLYNIHRRRLAALPKCVKNYSPMANIPVAPPLNTEIYCTYTDYPIRWTTLLKTFEFVCKVYSKTIFNLFLEIPKPIKITF